MLGKNLLQSRSSALLSMWDKMKHYTTLNLKELLLFFFLFFSPSILKKNLLPICFCSIFAVFFQCVAFLLLAKPKPGGIEFYVQ